MRSGAYSSTLFMQPEEEIVYSTGDLGRRLHTMFWIPGETILTLPGRFQMRYCLDWGGDDLIYDFGLGDYVPYDGILGSAGWTQPAASWENFGGGVTGRPGWAWWATDDDAPPYDTGGNPYDEANAADVEALARIVRSAQTYFRLEVRTRAIASDPWGNHDAVQVNIMQPEIQLVAKDTCVNETENLFVNVRIDNTAEAWMAGLQTIVNFDNTRLSFVGATAQGPFPQVVFGPIQSGATIRFANGVGFGDPEVNPVGTVTVATLEFQPLAGSSGCSISNLVTFGSWSGFFTDLTDDSGTSILFEEAAIGTVTIDLFDPVLVTVPGNVTTPCDAGETFATVPVTAPTATDNLACGNPVVTLLVTYPNLDTSPTLPAGNEYPIGVTTLQWTATDACGNTSTATTTITVNNTQVVNLDITLSGFVGGSHSRNVRVRWGTGVLNAVVLVPFTGANGTATVVIAPAGSYGCISVKDELHTLTDAVTPVISMGDYNVTAFLTQGDSNNDNKIDILDFGLFVGDFGPAAVNGRSNFNADLAVTNADFGYISVSFFTVGESCGGYATDSAPLAEVSVHALKKMGLSNLIRADINNDGWVNADDIALFLQGGNP